MWDFFKDPKWRVWSWGGAVIILASLYIGVRLDAKVNDWFGDFYNLIQRALSYPESVTLTDYFSSLAIFGGIAFIWIGVKLFANFLTQHWLFRWRTSMVQWYHEVFHKVHTLEGAAQRVQEDTVKFSRIVESLGTALVESILTLIVFFPILLQLSWYFPVTFFGDWDYGLVAGAVIWTIGGTIFMAGLSWLLRLVGVEYDIQVKEAAYRDMLVHTQKDGKKRPKEFGELFDDVRKIHFKNYTRYLYFNVGRLAYYQANVLTAYIFLAPAIVGGFITLGVMQQVVRAFGKVDSSMQYLINSWPTIIELASVHKRLSEFERQIKGTK